METKYTNLKHLPLKIIPDTVNDFNLTEKEKLQIFSKNNSVPIYFESEEPYSIVGALTEGRAVCEGYARSFKYIMDELGIPCVVVSGTGKNSKGETEAHAWNYVQVDDNWYAVDVTWDDPIIIGNGTVGSDIRYKHFLKGSNTFFSTHTEDGYITDNSIKFEFPQINKYDY